MNEDIINKLRSLKSVLKEKFGIEEFAVFGSVARGEDNEDSDIDIAVIKAKKKNYFDLLEVKYFLMKMLKKEIDIGYYDSIRPIFKKHINEDIIYV